MRNNAKTICRLINAQPERIKFRNQYDITYSVAWLVTLGIVSGLSTASAQLYLSDMAVESLERDLRRDAA